MAASIARLAGKPGVFTESFALSQNATLPRVKGVTAWQYASGITHMSTYGIQRELSTEDYGLFADFAGRLALLCRRGKPVADVAVLVPEASVWASYNPPDGGMFPHYIHCNPEAVHIDHVFRETCHRLAASQRDFEIVSEQLLAEAGCENTQLCIGAMQFDFLLLPEARMLQPSTLEKVEAFFAAGGHVAFVGSLPSQSPQKGIDEEMTGRTMNLLEGAGDQAFHVSGPDGMASLIQWMEDRVSPVLQWSGDTGIRMLHRREKGRDIFLLANPGLKDCPGELHLEIGGRVSLWDAATGEIEDMGKFRSGEAVQLKVPAEAARFIVLE